MFASHISGPLRMLTSNSPTRGISFRVSAAISAAIALTLTGATPLSYAATTTSAADTRVYVHSAKPGDTLGELAQRYLIDKNNWALLQRVNKIANPNRIPIGTPIRIPVAAMRTEAAPATVLSVSGNVQTNGAPTKTGEKLNEKDKLATGDDGFVTIKLADGSTITVQSKSAVELERARQLANTGGVGDTAVRLQNGRLTTNVTKQNGAARYEIKTPTANMGVRGTVFRVAADASGTRGQTEVVEGAVSAAATSGAAVGLEKGFGTIVEANKAPLPPVRLLAAPTLPSLPATYDATTLRLTLASVPSAPAYRAQAALDDAFTQLVGDVTSATPSIELPNLPDGRVFVRARAIDGQGLEGLDATTAITIAARPIPPVLAEPKTGARFTSGAVTMTWVAAPGAAQYRVEVARDSAFTASATQSPAIATTTFTPGRALDAGTWFWRVRSVDASGKAGPFSASQQFVIAPASFVIKPVVDGAEARFVWQAQAGQRFQVQLARNENFQQIIADRVVDKPEVAFDKLPKDVYFFRVRAVDDAGRAVSEWSTPQSVEVFAWPLR